MLWQQVLQGFSLALPMVSILCRHFSKATKRRNNSDILAPYVCLFLQSRSRSAMATKGKLLAVIGDQDTCTGFLLGGIGDVNQKRQKNFFVVSKDTTVTEIEEAFNCFIERTDIAIILINQKVAEEIRHVLDNYERAIPAVLEIPSKDYPYDSSKDSILRRAKGMFSAEDFR